MKKKYTYETNEQGKHKVIEQSNGVTVKILEEPSEKYMEKIKVRQEKNRINRKIAAEKQAKENLIKNKMREIAIKELEEEGKI